MIQAPPYEYITDRKIRKQLYEYQDYFKSVSDRKDFKFTPLAENFIHKQVVRNAKKRIVINFLKTADKNVLMEMFDNHQSKIKI
jgi:hypothetical protein